MINREDLERAFGADGVVTMNWNEAKDAGLSDENLFLLTRLGLPRDAGPLFTTNVVGSPELFTAQPYQSSGQDSVALFLGGPRDEKGMRYFLDVRDGYVVLLTLKDDGVAKSEIVNSSLADFLEFIFHLGVWSTAPAPSNVRGQKIETQEFVMRLMERDDFAFRRPDTWWSMAVEQLRR
ncbi:SUKH-4 immunity protein of toxin-antitoxin system [Nonomuraea polychroma]|uniref:SUKH-4 immunity protein of toxin-antitoxin system n=1 Tax=Nonomuraea polychroma TaxID=46176 RepID=A0A438MEH5_9ACTN|nr:SUKH-4 family immunity protein [Nonomuraea polychroma]RVX43921.1 SUKH-4 immunity protein of toxin-antitoxin system [Nonomuraea polychroma]